MESCDLVLAKNHINYEGLSIYLQLLCKLIVLLYFPLFCPMPENALLNVGVIVFIIFGFKVLQRE